MHILTGWNHELLDWAKSQDPPKDSVQICNFVQEQSFASGTALATNYVQPRLVFCHHQSGFFVNNINALSVKKTKNKTLVFAP